MLKAPEKFRITSGGSMATTSLDGNNGLFLIPMSIKRKETEKPFQYYISCLMTTNSAYENVIVGVLNKDCKSVPRFPTVDELKFVRRTLWEPDDLVLQYFIGEKMKLLPFTAALWRPMFAMVPLPPETFEGFTGKPTTPKIEV